MSNKKQVHNQQLRDNLVTSIVHVGVSMTESHYRYMALGLCEGQGYSEFNDAYTRPILYGKQQIPKHTS